jgi:hypothetical protein
MARAIAPGFFVKVSASIAGTHLAQDGTRARAHVMQPQLAERSADHWRLCCHDAGMRVGDAAAVARLRRLIDRIDAVFDVRVVVFDEASSTATFLISIGG